MSHSRLEDVIANGRFHLNAGFSGIRQEPLGILEFLGEIPGW